MLHEEGLDEEPKSSIWSWVGSASGAGLGFIIGNVTGMFAGAVAGNRLGAIRDRKGKSVYSVFQDLPQENRAKLLAVLASKVFSHAVGV